MENINFEKSSIHKSPLQIFGKGPGRNRRQYIEGKKGTSRNRTVAFTKARSQKNERGREKRLCRNSKKGEQSPDLSNTEEY